MSVTYLHKDRVSRRRAVQSHDPMRPITVLVADAQVLFADALASCLAHWEELRVLDDRPSNGVEVLQAAMEGRPQVILVDYWLGGMGGPTVAREILTRLPATKVVHLSWFHGPPHVEESLASGAVAFLPKSLRVEQVAEAVQRAAAGESPVFEKELSRLVDTLSRRAGIQEDVATRFDQLTPRELDVLRHLASGATVQDIAGQLGIRVATARTHVQRVLVKTQARSQLEAVAMARDQGLVE